ncbi:MAG: ArnT family glycosyltransferase, partial [Methylophilus sp.]
MDYSPKAWLNNRPWLTAFLFFIATYCLNLFISRDLWVQDEMRYGEVVREMLATGNWLVPHLNGAPYPDKPATYFWIVSAVSMLIGQGEMAFRLVSALSTLLAGSGVYLIGNKMAGRECGFWSAIIFGSTLLTLIVGQIVRMDMLLTAITTFTWLALLEFDSTAKKRHLIEFWVCCALSLAVKGPISLLFTLLPSIIWTLNKKGLAGLRQLRPILGLLAIIGMVIAWVVMVFQSGQGPYLSKIWHEQLVGRAINSWSHKEPIYFYLLLLPIFIMPWTGPILSGIWKTVKQDHTHISSIIFFALVPLIGISLVSGKLFIYIEPLVPALCIAGALAIEKTDQKTKVKAWYAWPPTLYLFGVSGLLVYLSKLYLGETSTQGIWIAIGVTMLAIISAIAT